MPYEIRVQGSFSAAHRLSLVGHRTEEIHGHNWRVEAVLRTGRLDSLGMVLDFEVLDRHLREVLRPLDHRMLNDLPAFSRAKPTSEHIARHIFDRLREVLGSKGKALAEVSVWETDAYQATYRARPTA